MVELASGDLKIRPLRDEDGPILHKWLNDSRVLAYYEGRDKPHDMDMVHKKFLSKTDLSRVLGCLVTWRGSPSGYVQVYPVVGEELTLYGYPQSSRIYGMDQFLGEPDLWNQGIGTLLVHTVVDWLFRECKADRVVMDPRVENTRAIHVYEKCGFRKVKLLPKRELHEGKHHDCWLMEIQVQGLTGYTAEFNPGNV
ncbi:GNAT family N-acetyltransferase [Alicyclobacillus suci]|uniref:GNAT family N-acetyltransferase n=1 Tax=Alicyclobacillus suci TaxID=2816080 RepID=UPI001A8E7EFE|nr:GNAT family N-acetyltransferase [Alicyclobacillus suci]